MAQNMIQASAHPVPGRTVPMAAPTPPGYHCALTGMPNEARSEMIRHGLGPAEAEARQRGCAHAHLRTFSFQARGFYERCGDRVIGALEGYPPGGTLYWLRKDFA
jgi:hypothetical protein